MQKDNYQILGVTRTADQAEIKAAFRIQLKKNHPDLNQDDKASAESRTRDIIDAYRTLGNTARRKLYDEKFRIEAEPLRDSPNQRSKQESKPNYFKAAARAVAVMIFFFSILGAATLYIISNNSSRRDGPTVEQREKIKSSGTYQSQIESPIKLEQRANGSKATSSSSRLPGSTPTPRAALAPEAVVPLAQRAAILVEAPEEPSKTKTFVGSSIWRFDTSDEPPTLVADISLPDAKLSVTMRMTRNMDPKLPASHTMEFRFTHAAGPGIAGIAKIDTPQMRIEGSANGAPLAGVPAHIMANYFLVGLSNGDKQVSRNIELMRDRGWIDIPMVLSNGRIAKLTFEKGASGDRAVAQAIQTWRDRTKYDSTAMSDLLSREAPSQKASTMREASQQPSWGAPTDNALRMAPSLRGELDSLMQERYRRCWEFQGTTATRYIPQIKVEFRVNGALANEPLLVNSPRDLDLRGLAESALQAVRRCDPLPIPTQFAPYHNEWKSRILRFDPEEMVRSGLSGTTQNTQPTQNRQSQKSNDSNGN